MELALPTLVVLIDRAKDCGWAAEKDGLEKAIFCGCEGIVDGPGVCGEYMVVSYILGDLNVRKSSISAMKQLSPYLSYCCAYDCEFGAMVATGIGLDIDRVTELCMGAYPSA